MILLPSTPLPQTATPMPVDFGGWQEPIAGGPVTRLDRLGNRFAIDFAMPRMRPSIGRVWASRLSQATGSLVRMAVPQPGVEPNGENGAVDGANQTGFALTIRGVSAGYPFVEGQFINLLDSAGRFYLHQVSADVIVNGGGKAMLAIWPMVRFVPADGASIRIAAPAIEGRLSGNEKGWTMERAGTRGLQFTVAEAR